MKKKIFIFYFFFKFLFLSINPSYSFISLNCSDTISVAITIQQTCQNNDTLIITNVGSVILTGSDAIDADSKSGVTIDNKGTISASVNQAIDMQNSVNTTVTNSGTIEAGQINAILMDGTSADNNTINNSGTLKAGKTQVILATNSENTTIINSGSIETTNSSNPNTSGINYYNTSASAIDGATITNTGTIFAYGAGIRFGTSGNASKAINNMTITNSGTIEGGTASILVNNTNATGTNIITEDEGTYTGKIDLNGTETTFTLDCSISKDQDIEISNKTEITIVNNLCGNDTYVILDSNKNPDRDNSETNGYLRIYGEELDLVSDNKKYRTEIFQKGVSQVFKSIEDIKEQSVFFSKAKRDNIYSNSTSGVSGYFLNNEYEEDKLRAFLSYFEQSSNFNSKEKIKSENLAFGYNVDSEIKNLSTTPLFGISINKVTDIETESNEIKKNNFLGTFIAINSNYKSVKKFSDNHSLSLKVSSEYGAHKLNEYLTNFTHGDLSVDEAIDQVFMAGFDVEYEVKSENGFIFKPYSGLSFHNTLSNDIVMYDINGADIKENISQGHVMNGVLAKKVGFSLTKNTNDIGFSLGLEHSNQDGLIDNNINLSISMKLQKIAKRRKEDEKLDPELEKLFNRLQIVRENERIAKVANKLNNENKLLKDLIIKLIKENQKLKFENKILTKD